ncbi:putative reverse transcriptase domain-containing protein [Tanacetum coccineum]
MGLDVAALEPNLTARRSNPSDGTFDSIIAIDTTLPPPSVVNNGIQHVVKKQDNTIGLVSFATLLKGKSSRKQVNFRTLPTQASNGADVVISKESFSIVNKRSCNSVYGFFLGKRVAFPFSSNDGMNSMLENGSWLIRNVALILKKWSPDANIMEEDESCGRSIYARAMIELWAQVESKDNLVVDIPKLGDNGYIRSTICVSDVSKNLKMPRQTAFGLPVGLKPKSNFVYRSVQPTNKTSDKKNNVSTIGNKKQVGLSRQEVSNLNPFDALNSVENDDGLGMNRGKSKLAEKEADSGMVSSAHGSSPMASGGLNTTPLTERINKLERKMLDGKLMLVMAAPTIHVSAKENLGDPIDMRVDIIHLEPIVAVAFPAAAVVRTQAQHKEAIRGIHGHLLGVPIQEKLTALRFRVDIAEAENASLRARIKTNEAVEKITRNHERLARIEIEQQLAAVQESHRQDREDFKKLEELVTS